VLGYSSSEQILAIERKEVDGTCVSYDSLLASAPAMAENKHLNWLILLNSEPVPELPGTPPATEFARSAEDRQMLEFLIARNLLGRPYLVARQVPEDRVAMLRLSFMATMKDSDYLAEATRLKLTVKPVDHLAMEEMIARTYAIPQAIIGKAIALTKDQ